MSESYDAWMRAAIAEYDAEVERMFRVEDRGAT
jgi:hypothetical protein